MHNLGCGKLFSIDGNWKLSYPIFMFRVPQDVSGFDGALHYVDCCPNQPAAGMAYCEDHCQVATRKGIPCKLQAKVRTYQWCSTKLIFTCKYL